jgi:hypothetical protein
MNPVTAEKLNAEAWIERHATHTCPHWGGRFNPAQCCGRKTKAQRIAERHSPGWDWVQNSAGYDLSRCLECDGPIPILEGTKMKPAKELSELSEIPIQAAKQETTSDDKVGKYPYRCKTCGKVGAEHFYQSVRNYCKACCKARDKERYAARPQKYALIVGPEGKENPVALPSAETKEREPNPPESPPEPPRADPGPVPFIPDGESVICPSCNKPHNGFLVGRDMSKTCKECIFKKRNATWQGNKARHKKPERSCYAKAADTIQPAGAEVKPVPSQSVETAPGPDLNVPPPPLFNLAEERDRKLLLNLQVLAALERRTLEQQIVYLVEVALRGMESGQ